MLLKVTCFNIIYTGRESYITINSDNLRNFVEHGFMDCYNGDSAPKQLDVIVETRNLDDFDQLEKDVKKQLEEDTGLTVKSFGFKYGV